MFRGTFVLSGTLAGAISPLLEKRFTVPLVALGVLAALVGMFEPIRRSIIMYIRWLGYEPPIPLDPPNNSVRESAYDSIGRALASSGLSSQRPGRMTLDLSGVLSGTQDLHGRVVFPFDDSTLDDICHLNTIGFADSPYGTSTDVDRLQKKRSRNRDIAEQHPFAFAGVLHPSNSNLYVGFSAVVPLTKGGSVDYLYSPGISDNDLTGELVARVGEEFDTVLLFALSTIKLRRGHRGFFRDPLQVRAARRPDVAAVRDIARATVLQLSIILSLSSNLRRVRVIGQSRVRSVQKLFDMIGMRHDVRYTSRDNEPLYLADLEVRGHDVAQASLLRLWTKSGEKSDSAKRKPS